MGRNNTNSVDELLEKVDFVLLETNDGRLHLEQAMQDFQAGKTVFIDKPIAASLGDEIKLFEAAKTYRVPVFSASSMSYMGKAIEVRQGEIAQFVGAANGKSTRLKSSN